MPEKVIVPLDPESVRRLLGNPTSLLKGAPGIEEVGDDYVVVTVPRLFGLGHRRLKLNMSVHETEEVIVIILRSGMDSIVVTIHIIDTGEGAHIVVSGGGSGRVAKMADAVVATINRNIAQKIESSTPTISIVEQDNRLAALQEPLPPKATVVYYDSFTPVRDVPREAALRILALLGIDDYLVELTDYRGVYLVRMVLRGNRITGAYAKWGEQEAVGEQALTLGRRPPGHRVGIRAWSLTGSSEALLYEPDLIAGGEGHALYWFGGQTRLDYGGLAPNSYIIMDDYEAAVIDPVGDDKLLRGVRLVVSDTSQIRYVLVTSLEAGAETGVERLASVLPNASFVSTSYWASQIGLSSRAAAPRIDMLPARETTIRLGKAELLVIPSTVRGASTFSIYDKLTKTLITGPSLGVVTPPGLWSIRSRDLEEYITGAKGYVKYSVCPAEFRSWLDRVSKLDIERIAPRYGPILEGRREVRKLLESLQKI